MSKLASTVSFNLLFMLISDGLCGVTRKGGVKMLKKSTTLFMDGTLGVGARMGAHWRFAEDAPVQGLGTLAAGGRCC